VGVDDVWATASDELDQMGQGSSVIAWADAAAEALDSGCLDVRGLGFEIVGFVVVAVAGYEALTDYLGIQPTHELDYFDSRAPNIHAGDDVHNLDGLGIPHVCNAPS